MTVYAYLVVIVPASLGALYLFGDALLTVSRRVQDYQHGWTCACGARFTRRDVGPASFHALAHGSSDETERA